MTVCEVCKVAPASVTVYEPFADDRSLCALCLSLEDEAASAIAFDIERLKSGRDN